MKSKGCFRVLLIFFMSFDHIRGSATYKSIIWDHENPLFKNDCPSGKPKLFNVEANSKINFVCPNVATMMDSTLREVTKANRYENLWLVHNSAAFDGCNVMQDPRHFLLMRCEDPTSLQFRTVIFQRYSAEHHLTFQKGKSYFLISTCNGKMSSVNNKVGGHCYGTANGGFMKLEMHVCKDEDTACLENVGKLHCQEEPSSSHVLNTATVPHTAAVSSHTQSPTEGKTNPCKEVLNLLVKKGAPDSESEDKCKIWKIAVACSSGFCIAAFFCLCCKCFWKKRMKRPDQYDVKVESSKRPGLENDGFERKTDVDSLKKKGGLTSDVNEKGSLKIKTGGQ